MRLKVLNATECLARTNHEVTAHAGERLAAGEGPVPKQNDSQTQRPSPWGFDPTDRLFNLFSAFATLRQDSRALVNQLRGSIHQLRQLRGQLREHTAGSSGDGTHSQSRKDLYLRYGLTRREHEVAHLLAEGKSNAAIAQELRISAHTARHHTQRVLAKLAVHSRAEAGAKLRE
jgi:DNA-binding CsgD family transcriptional regulator